MERLEDPLTNWSAVNNLKLEEWTTSGWMMMGQVVSGGPRGNNVRQDKEAIVIVNRIILNKRCLRHLNFFMLSCYVSELSFSFKSKDY